MAGKNSPIVLLRKFGAILGPGLVTGAADDDPSGIFTYSQSGAQFGLGQLWTVFFMLPLLISVQEMCTRIAIVTDKGLATVIRENYSKLWLYGIVGLLLLTNTINLGADLGAMAESSRLIIKLSYIPFVLIFGLVGLVLEILVPYRRYAPYLKILTVSLFAYFLTGCIATRGWYAVFKATFIPQVHFNFQFLMIIVGVLGTTISPYMFFWQAAQQREENHEKGRCGKQFRKAVIKDMRIDTVAGMLFSEVAAWFIILTTAEVLYPNGVRDIHNAAQAAAALEPFVHRFPHSGFVAELLFCLGIIGTGLLAVPIFAASSAYAFCDCFGRKESLAMRFSQARSFYGVIAAGTIAGVLLNYIGIDPIKALIYAAVLNGVVALPMIYLLIRVSARKDIMGEYVSGAWSKIFTWITLVSMTAAAALAVYTFFLPGK
jgi:NRAMP (natural resistance-associated macrophage protein)-like metal ion transporter